MSGWNKLHPLEHGVTLHILDACGFVRCHWAGVVLTRRETCWDLLLLQGISCLTATQEPEGNEAILMFLQTTNTLHLTVSEPNIHLISTFLGTCISVYQCMFEWIARCAFDASVFWENREGDRQYCFRNNQHFGFYYTTRSIVHKLFPSFLVL